MQNNQINLTTGLSITRTNLIATGKSIFYQSLDNRSDRLVYLHAVAAANEALGSSWNAVNFGIFPVRQRSEWLPEAEVIRRRRPRANKLAFRANIGPLWHCL